MGTTLFVCFSLGLSSKSHLGWKTDFLGTLNNCKKKLKNNLFWTEKDLPETGPDRCESNDEQKDDNDEEEDTRDSVDDEGCDRIGENVVAHA